MPSPLSSVAIPAIATAASISDEGFPHMRFTRKALCVVLSLSLSTATWSAVATAHADATGLTFTTATGAGFNTTTPAIGFAGAAPGETVSLLEWVSDGTSGTDKNTLALDGATVAASSAGAVTPTAPLADGDHSFVLAQSNGALPADDLMTWYDENSNDASSHTPNMLFVHTENDPAPQIAFSDSSLNTTITKTKPAFVSTGGPASGDSTLGLVWTLTDAKGNVLRALTQNPEQASNGTTFGPSNALALGAYQVWAYTVDSSGHVGSARSNVISFTVVKAPKPKKNTSYLWNAAHTKYYGPWKRPAPATAVKLSSATISNSKSTTLSMKIHPYAAVELTIYKGNIKATRVKMWYSWTFWADKHGVVRIPIKKMMSKKNTAWDWFDQPRHAAPFAPGVYSVLVITQSGWYPKANEFLYDTTVLKYLTVN